MSRGASLASFLPWQYPPPSLPVSALLPWQYQPSFLASISFPSLAVPASFATSSFLSSTQKLPSMNPYCALHLYILTHPSPQFEVQRPQRRRKEGAQRRCGQRRQDRVLARKEEAADRKGDRYAWGLRGHFAGDTLRDTLRDTETRVCGRAAFQASVRGFAGTLGLRGTQKLRVCSQSSVLGISERDSVVHVDVVSISLIEKPRENTI